MNERRSEKFRLVAGQSQLSLTVILENIHDPHNIGAILRTCDSVGIRKIFVVNEDQARSNDVLVLGKRSSMGTRKWVDVHYFRELDACIEQVRSEYGHIAGAALSHDAVNYLDTNYTGSIAIMLGNEQKGLSPRAIRHCDSLIYIPQVGMAESLNVSTAAAIILYEAYRQRSLIGRYGADPDVSAGQAAELLKRFQDKVFDRTRNEKRFRVRPFETGK